MSHDPLPESALRTADRDLMIPEGHHRGEELSAPQRAFYRFLWVVTQTIAMLYFRRRVEGGHHVPAHGAFIVAPVHRSNLDTPLVSGITRRRLRYMGKESLWKSRFGAWMLTTAGGFPVERGTADRAALRASMAVVERGEPLVMFPEGTRQSGPVVQKFFDGPAYVACRAQVPILPVGIGGTERAMPKGRKVPPPVKLVMIVGEPIQPPPLSAAGDRVPRRAVRELTTRLHGVVQELFDEAQRAAGTPNS